MIVGSQVYGDKEDRRSRYGDVVGVDMLAGPGVDVVLDLEEPLPDDIGQFDHVECMSVLEHSKRPWLLAANIERLMSPGATLFVTVPFCWRLHSYPSDYFRFTCEGVRAIFPGIEWSAVAMVDTEIRKTEKVRGIKIDGHPYFPRSEVCAFGRRP